MPRSRRFAASISLGALAAATLTPAAAHASGSHFPAHITGGAKPALSRARTFTAPATTTEGITPALTATAVTGEGLTFSLDSTASSDSNSGATITGYSFGFGDGTAAVANASGTTSHTYTKPGTYAITVTVTDSAGNSATATTTVVTTGSDYTPLDPDRILDSRSGIGTTTAKLTPTHVISLKVVGTDSVPSDATGVVLNLTAVDTTGSGVVTCYPDTQSTPTVSNLNFSTGETINNLITVPVPTDGTIDCADTGAANSSTDLIGDLQGYYSPDQSNGYTAIDPGRFLDTRSGLGTAKAKLVNGKSIAVAIDGASATTSKASNGATTTETLPTSGIAAVAINITVTNTVGNGIISAYADQSTHSGSNINYTAGSTIPIAAIVKVGTDGKIDLASTGSETTSTDIIADVEGYYTAASPAVYVSVAPKRVVDTRSSLNGQVQAGVYYNEKYLDTANGTTAYILNTTVTGPTAGGNLAAIPAGNFDPLFAATSNLNFSASQTVANLTQTTASATGINFQNFQTSGNLELVIDEFGYLTTQ